MGRSLSHESLTQQRIRLKWEEDLVMEACLNKDSP
jgi:hypothetical protein